LVAVVQALLEILIPAHVLQKLPVKVLVVAVDIQVHVELSSVEQQPLDRHAKAMMAVMVIPAAMVPVEGAPVAPVGPVSLTQALAVAALVYSVTSQELDYILLAGVEGVITVLSATMGGVASAVVAPVHSRQHKAPVMPINLRCRMAQV